MAKFAGGQMVALIWWRSRKACQRNSGRMDLYTIGILYCNGNQPGFYAEAAISEDSNLYSVMGCYLAVACSWCCGYGDWLFCRTWTCAVAYNVRDSANEYKGSWW